VSKTFVLRRQDLGAKEVRKVQQVCLARGETDAEELHLDISMALPRTPWLIGTDPAKGRQGSARMPYRENRTC
jgi:hypothetical protein